MAIYEIILCVVILLASVLVCAVTLAMDKADKNALGVINGLSGSLSNSMMKNSKDSNKNSANNLFAKVSFATRHPETRYSQATNTAMLAFFENK